MGSSFLVSRQWGPTTSTASSTRSRTARLLSESNTGALIVIEREVGLEEYVESGVRMDATLSTEILLNIFTPNTPLHDGAVIIRDAVGRRGRVLLAP